MGRGVKKKLRRRLCIYTKDEEKAERKNSPFHSPFNLLVEDRGKKRVMPVLRSGRGSEGEEGLSDKHTGQYHV